MHIDGKEIHRIKIGGRFRFANLTPEVQEAIKVRLAEKDNVMARSMAGEVPGILIDGKKVTRDNIHEFEIDKKPREIIKEGKIGKLVSKKIYTKEQLKEMEFNDLRDIGDKLKVKGRSKRGLIKDILEAQLKIFSR